MGACGVWRVKLQVPVVLKQKFVEAFVSHTPFFLILKSIRDNKRRYSAGFAYRLKYWAHCTTRYISVVTYLVVTSLGCIRPRTFVFMQCLPLQYWVMYVFYVIL